jgi:hypothetical protein
VERADGMILADNVLVERDGQDYSGKTRICDAAAHALAHDEQWNAGHLYGRRGCTDASNVAGFLSAITPRLCAVMSVNASIVCRSGRNSPPGYPALSVAGRHGRD